MQSDDTGGIAERRSGLGRSFILSALDAFTSGRLLAARRQNDSLVLASGVAREMDNVWRAPRVCSTGPTNTLHDLGIRFVDGGEVDVEAVSLLSEPAKAND